MAFVVCTWYLSASGVITNHSEISITSWLNAIRRRAVAGGCPFRRLESALVEHPMLLFAFKIAVNKTIYYVKSSRWLRPSCYRLQFSFVLVSSLFVFDFWLTALTCPSGEYFDLELLECHDCPPGTYSLGGMVRHEIWDQLPDGFSVLVEPLTSRSSFSMLERERSFTNCSRFVCITICQAHFRLNLSMGKRWWTNGHPWTNYNKFAWQIGMANARWLYRLSRWSLRGFPRLHSPFNSSGSLALHLSISRRRRHLWIPGNSCGHSPV